MRKVLLLALALPLFATKYAGEIFYISPHVRAEGFGGVAVPLGSSPFGFFSNPAIVEGNNILFNYSSLYSGLASFNFFGFSKENFLGHDTDLGVSVALITSSDIKQTALLDTARGVTEGNIYIKERLTFRSTLFSAAFAKNWRSTRIGLKAKVFNENLGVTSGTGFGIDAGLFWHKGPLSVGAVIRDLTGTPIVWRSHREYIYPSIQTGATYLVKGHLLLGTQFDLLFEGRKVSSTYSVGPFSMDTHFGFEYIIGKASGVRVGINRGNMTFGAGFQFKKLTFNYGYTSHSSLGSTSKFSVAIRI